LQNGNPNTPTDTEVSLTPKAAALLRLLPEEISGERRYEIGRLVSQGGMGAILEARQAGIHRTVAMKVMLGETSEETMARFIWEARITGQLEHPNIVPVHEIGIDEREQIFYTMKFVNGVTLHEALSRLKKEEPEALRRFSLAELLNIFQKVCDAVAFAHSKGVIHRDLKPANVMLGDFGEALVVDWGLAKHLADPRDDKMPLAGSAAAQCCATQTLNGSVLGTPSFMPPEQAGGEPSKVDRRSDIYALGAILHMLLYLRPPITGKDVSEILANVRAGRVEPPVRNLPHLPGGRVPESLQAVVCKATALKPEDRYQTVAELQADVTAYQNGFATRAENAGLWKQTTLAIHRYKSEAVLTAFALVVLTALAAFSFVKVTRERNRSEKALTDLRGAAPAFLSQARSYALAERFTEALDRLDYALKLRPKDPEYLLAKANLLQACLQFDSASHIYRTVEGPLRSLAHANAALSDRLSLEIKESGALSKESMADLFTRMVKEQRPASELMPLARLLGRERELAVDYWSQRLRELPFALDPPIEKRLTARPDGTLSLDLRATAITDLRALSGMPLGELNISHCVGVSDLAPLQDAPLVSLDISDTAVTDLSPLRSCTLRSLSIRSCAIKDIRALGTQPLLFLDVSNTEITDFSPLSGSHLETLLLENTKVGDLSFLKGLPLKALRLDKASEARGFSTLATLPFLETLILPQTWFQLPAEDIVGVRNLSVRANLKRLSARPMQGRRIETAETAEEFWKEWMPDLVWIERLLHTGAKPKLIKLPDQTWQIDLHDSPTDDISAIVGARVSHLDISTTLVRDLRPLTGAPLTYLDLRNTPVTNIESLRGMPLRTVYLHKTKVTEFSALSTLRDLELLDVSVTGFSDLSILNAPHLAELRIGSTLITNLSPLSRFPLKRLHCDSVNVTSLAPLLNVPTLIWLIPPKHVPDVILLRSLPNLKLISYDWHPDSEPTLPPEKFWQSPAVLALQQPFVDHSLQPDVDRK
jgi:Leucine-rich repeat (LRR) protein